MQVPLETAHLLHNNNHLIRNYLHLTQVFLALSTPSLLDTPFVFPQL
jgi:hypothetical protein